MKNICIQMGHVNIKYNCDTTLQSGTGAPNEATAMQRITNKLCEVLRTKGFNVTHTDANANCDKNITDKDFDLFLSIHWDANVYGTGGGFVDFPEPSTDDATLESQRIAKAIREEYFSGNTGIVNHPERSNANTRYYYMWQYLTAKTPCVILECGVGADAHDSVILADTDRICNGIARGICKAFNVPFDTVIPVPVPPTPPTDSCKVYKDDLIVKDRAISDRNDTILRLNNDLKVANDKINGFQTEMSDKLSEKDRICLQKLQDYKAKVVNLTKTFNEQITSI